MAAVHPLINSDWSCHRLTDFLMLEGPSRGLAVVSNKSSNALHWPWHAACVVISVVGYATESRRTDGRYWRT